jgi:hypothetical protein
LDELVDIIREKGFENTNLVEELIEIPKNQKSGFLLTEIEKEMHDSDFNIFILFPKENNSVIVELTSFVKSKDFEKKQDRFLLCLPYDYNASMVIDLIGQKKLNVFYYNEAVEIQQKCFVFIKSNLVS